MVIPPDDDGLPMSLGRLLSNGGVLLLSMAFFAACFLGSYHWAMPRFSRHFLLMSRPVQADFASRVHSTIHAVLVPAGLLGSIFQCGIWGEPLVNTCRSAELFFSVSLGYFLVDLIIILWFRIEFWNVFAFHHTVALLPYAINNFLPHCSHTHFLLSLMLGVEVSTVFLNAKWLLEQTDCAAGTLYAACFYTTYASWFIVRVINPIYVVLLMVNYVFPYYGVDLRVLTSYIALCIVAVFCWYCFLFIFTPEVCQRLRRKKVGRPSSTEQDEETGADRQSLMEEDDDGKARSLGRTRSRSDNLSFA